MGEGGEAAEVFKSLFGGFSGSLSLFTNNPYQRASAAAEEAPAFESVKKEKKKVVEEFKEAEVEAAAEKKKSKKKKDTENAVDAQLQEEVKSKKKKKKKSVEAAVVVEDVPPSGKTPVKEKRAKRKVVEEEIREEFEEKFRGSDGKKAKSESLGVHSEDPEIDHILHESLQEENKTQGKRKFLDDDDGVAVPTKKKPKKTKKEVEEEEEKLLRTVFVGNLPTTVKKKQIIREFSQFGKVASARLRSIALVDTKLPRKAAVITGQVNEKRTSQNAYVVFEEVESAKAALVHNMAEFQGKHIRVDMASAPRKDSKPGIDTAAEYDRTRSLFVGNVPFEVEEEDLYKVFANDNPELSVEAIRVPRDPQTSISKGFGFVLFKTKAGANAALAKKSTKIGERYLRVVKMGSQQRLKKQSAPPAGSFRNNATAGKRLSEGGSGATPPGKKGPLPWEGARAAKSDGKPGKGALGRLDARRTSQGGSAGKASGDPAPKVRLTKRPAVLARKQAQLFKAGKGPPPPKPKSKNVKGGGRSNPKKKAK